MKSKWYVPPLSYTTAYAHLIHGQPVVITQSTEESQWTHRGAHQPTSQTSTVAQGGHFTEYDETFSILAWIAYYAFEFMDSYGLL